MRAASWVFFFFACVFAAYDCWEYVDYDDETLLRLQDVWLVIDAGSLNALQKVVQHYFYPEFWADFLHPVLRTPAVLVAAALGFVFSIPRMFEDRRPTDD